MTKRLILNDPDRVCKWTAERIGCAPWNPDFSGAVGLEKDGELIAGVVIDNYIEHGAASMHAAVANKYALDKIFIQTVFRWLFIDLDLKVLINRVAASNTASMRATATLGFREFARFPLAWYGEDDLVLFELRRENCRWVGESHG